MAVSLAALDYGERSRLLEAYETYAQWQIDEMPNLRNTLAELLRAFPNLTSIRVDESDLPAFLGGWLQPRDQDLLARHKCGSGRLYTRIITSMDVVDALKQAKLL